MKTPGQLPAALLCAGALQAQTTHGDRVAVDCVLPFAATGSLRLEIAP